MTTSGNPATLPYQEMTDAQYASVAAGQFVIDDYGAGAKTLRGPCPRCGAAIEILVFQQVVRDIFAEIAGEGDVALAGGSPAEPVICTCDEPHPGRPEGQVGCGAYWKFYL